MMIIGFILLLLLVVLVVGGLFATITIVPETYEYIVENLGSYKTTWQTGVHFKIPFVQRIAAKVSLKEQVSDFDPQPVITQDNVTMQIDTVVYYQVTESKLFTYKNENPILAIEVLSATTLRNLIGYKTLDETLTSREEVNSKLQILLDEATDPWGIKVNRVELKNIEPPQSIKEAMEKQMKAERTKKAMILEAEGEQESTVKRAQGAKDAKILEAEADKQYRILKAQGEAESIRLVQEATAISLKLLNEAAPTEKVLKLKGYEALEKASEGQATKIIIPADFQNIASIAAVGKEVVVE